MKMTRRDVVIGSTAVGVGGCICSPFEAVDEVYEDDGLAARDPEDDEMPVLQPAPAPTKFYDPLHMTASVLVQANSQAAPNTVNLQNTTGQYIEILEIKWELTPSSASFLSGAVMGCQLNLGNIPITNGFVPVWNFGPGRAFQYEVSSTSRSIPIQYTWKLPRPMLIPPGGVLAPIFQHRGLIPIDVTTRISYACRVLPIDHKIPNKVNVPYVAFYASKVFDVQSLTPDSDSSTELDLTNRFDAPLRIHRFVGRINEYALTSIIGVAGNNNSDVVFNHLGSRLLRVRMTDSRGEPVIPAPTMFRQVFDGPTRTWDADFILPPKSFYTAVLTREAVSAVPANIQIQGQAMISMVGWHEMKGGY
jgi:hypothetical protein